MVEGTARAAKGPSKAVVETGDRRLVDCGHNHHR